MNRVVIHQPSYLPWIGLFDRIAQADLFIVYDNVQYDKHGWRNRNRIKTAAGSQWLTVPILTKHRSGMLVSDALVNPQVPWSRKHLQAIRVNYARAPYADRYLKPLAEILDRPWAHLMDLDLTLQDFLFDALGMRVQQMKATALGDTSAPSASERLAILCQRAGATEYISPDAAKDYLDPRPLEAAGVTVRFHGYQHPVYPQLHGPFIPHLSVIDLLMNCGEQSLATLTHRAPSAVTAP